MMSIEGPRVRAALFVRQFRRGGMSTLLTEERTMQIIYRARNNNFSK